MGRGQPTSRPADYMVTLEVLLQKKDDCIRELEAENVMLKSNITILSKETAAAEAKVARVEAQQQSWDIEVEKLYAQNFDTTASAVASCSEDILQAIKGGK